MTKGEGKKKLTLKKVSLFLVGTALVGFCVWIIYERFFYVSPSVKAANNFWNNAYKEMEK
jgi:hypothetical protein